jgi:hypothetical protein
MRPIWIIFIIIVLICAGLYVIFGMKMGGLEQTSGPITSVTQPIRMSPAQEQIFCLPTQLKASIDSQGAAGNIYGKITIKNISQTTCHVIGNNELKVEYPTSVQNFQIVQKGESATEIFTLAPNQAIYSLIHFSDSPQCSSKLINIATFVTYAFSRKDILIFSSNRGNIITIPSCENVSEKTQIDLYPFSRNEIEY